MFLSRVKRLVSQSSVRLALSLIVVFLVATAFAGALTFLLVQREINRMADTRLIAQATLIETALKLGESPSEPALGQYYLIISDNSTIGRLPFDTPDERDGRYFLDRRGPEFHYLSRTLPSGTRIIVSENADRQDELLDTLLGGLFISLAGMLFIGIVTSIWFSLRAQKRLDLINEGLAKVANGHLDTQIKLPGRHDDLSLLAERINATTRRLSQSMQQMRVQSSNIAHDLRTPLARLRASLESSLDDLIKSGQPMTADTLGSALEQIDQLVATFNALLRLSRVETGAGKSAFKRVDLGPLITHVAEIYAPVMEDQGQYLVVHIVDPLGINGDWDLMVQLLANLIQNALRYGAVGQTVTIQVQGSVVSVIDQGPGIPPDEREKVLRPLYQLEQTRQNYGFGLGLSMVAAICTLHDATLQLSASDTGQGLTVTMRFPKLTKL
jgi:signal transduction histidine kinase